MRLASAVACVVLAAGQAAAQNASTQKRTEEPSEPAKGDPRRDDQLSAAEADDGVPDAARSPWNEWVNDYFTLRVGGGFLVDYVTYAQDDDSEELMELEPDLKLRDARLLLKGKLKFLGPRVTYTVGYMYDGGDDDWRWRQTGIMVAFPEVNGQIFVGRTKEGFSTSKIMVGYNGWTNERSAANDALLPILNDGIKWTGGAFSGKLVYNLGVFTDAIGPGESYVKNDFVAAMRAVWLPFAGPESRRVLHIALEGRYGTDNGGSLQYKSKPESFPAQSNAVDTGKFEATGSWMGGVEAYYSSGGLALGFEYYGNQVTSGPAHDPFFHGGDLVAAYIFGGVRAYNSKGAFFEQVVPTKPLFGGGAGAIELVLRTSYVDLDSGPIGGGKFWRVTPMVNWHITNNVRFELVYGYGIVDRAEIQGGTHFVQTRLQLQLI